VTRRHLILTIAMPMSSEQSGRYIQADFVRWSTLARERNITLEN
jgi:hypothetical protein